MIFIVIGLIVFLLIVLAFTGKINVFENSQTCQGMNGQCLAARGEASCKEGELRLVTPGCVTKDNPKAKSGPCCIAKKEVGLDG